jgi:uncharacterized protein YraI
MKTFLTTIALFIAIIANSQAYQVVTTANLNFRSHPTIAENIILTIPKGTAIYVVDAQTNPNWALTKINNRLGYVSKKYLRSPKPSISISNNKTEKVSPSGPVRYYTNSRNERVQSPTFYPSQPTGATAICRDGTYSFSRSRRGTCSGHGGVSRWL